MNLFHHKDLGNHLLQLCPKVVKHPVYFVLFKRVNECGIQLQLRCVSAVDEVSLEVVYLYSRPYHISVLHFILLGYGSVD